MRKLLAYFRVHLSEALVYRATSFIWFFADFGPSLVLVIFWLAAYQSRQFIAGYSLSQMLLYYFGVSIISSVIIPHPHWWLKDQILYGQFAGIFLLKPVNLFWERLAAQLSWRTIRLLFVIPASIILFKLIAPSVGQFDLSLPRLGWLVLALLLSFTGQMFFKICLGLSAIWFGEIAWLVNFWDFSMALFGGAYFPLNLYPAWVQTVSSFLPWRYFFYFPLSIFLGQVDPAGMLKGFFGLGFWLLIGGLTYHLVLTRGIKKYSAFGG